MVGRHYSSSTGRTPVWQGATRTAPWGQGGGVGCSSTEGRSSTCHLCGEVSRNASAVLTVVLMLLTEAAVHLLIVL